MIMFKVQAKQSAKNLLNKLNMYVRARKLFLWLNGRE